MTFSSSAKALAALVGAWALSSAAAQVAQGRGASLTVSTNAEVARDESAGVQSAPTASPLNGKAQAEAGAPQKLSAGISDILRMSHAGVSTDVILVYIENSPIAYTLGAADIIALKEHGVPDEVTKALVKRGAALRSRVLRSLEERVGRVAYPVSNRHYGGFDPDGYDYFQYYYLYPRTLAAANQRLLTPYPAFAPGLSSGYGYYGPLPFQPFPPSAIRGP